MKETVKNAVSSAMQAVSKIPVSGIIKAGIFVGVAGFTLYVLIKHQKAVIKTTNDTSKLSPVDELLGKTYTSNPDDFDDLDELTQKICKKMKGKPAKHKTNAKKTNTKKSDREDCDIFDDNKRKKSSGKKTRVPSDIREAVNHSKIATKEFKDWAAANSKAYQNMVDDAARDLGLEVDTSDDDISEDVRKRYSMLF